MYSKKVIEYFNNEDRREIEDLVNQINDGQYDDELSSLSKKEKEDFILALENNYSFDNFLNVLKRINHIGAKIILADYES